MNHKLNVYIVVLVLVSLVLAACSSAAPTTAPAATEAPAVEPAVTEAPTSAPAATEAPTVTEETAACPPPVDMSTMELPANPKKITISFYQEPDNVLSLYSPMTYSWWLSQIVGQGLGQWDDKNNYVPQLAAEVPTIENGGISADGLTITWHLKPCLYWSDGQPLTSKDLLFTWQSTMDPDNVPYLRYGWDKIESIDTPDELTAVLHFKELYPGWSNLFLNGANTPTVILPAHIIEGHTQLEKDPFVHQPNVSAGPFVLTEWVSGDHMILTANPNYYQGKPKLDQIAIKFVPDPETSLSALKTGDIDFSADFSVADIPTLEGLAPDVQLRVDPSSNLEYFHPNYGTMAGVELADGTVVGKSDLDGPCPLKDVRVRKAFLFGINRQSIVDNLLYGKSSVPTSMWPNSYWENTNLTPEPYDPDQANKLLDEAGYTMGADGIREGTCDGQKVKLSFSIMTTNKQLRIDETTAMQNDLKKIGIELKPNLMPGGTFFGGYADSGPMPTGNFDVAGYMAGLFPDPDPLDWFICKSVVNKENPAGGNWTHLCDPELDELIAQINSSADPEVRKQVLDEVQQYMYDQAYLFFLYGYPYVYGYSSRLILPPTSGYSGWAWNTYEWDVK